MKRPNWIPDAVTVDLWWHVWLNLFAGLFNAAAFINGLFFGTSWFLLAINLVACGVSAWIGYQSYRQIPERKRAMQDQLIQILRG